jgi:hypothetical protein
MAIKTTNIQNALLGVDISDATAVIADVKSPDTFYAVAPPKKTGAMPTVKLLAGNSAYPQGYHAGDPVGLVHVEPNLNSYNIVDGTEIFGVHGTAGYFTPYYSETLLVSKALAKKAAADQSLSKSAPLPTVLKYTCGDDPTDYIKQITPALAASKSITAKASADHSVAKNAAVASEVGWQMLINGYEYEHPQGTITDETAAAQSGTPNGMDLAYAAVNDASYFCAAYKFNRIWLNIGTAGAGNWTLLLEYWNGSAWVSCVGEIDHTNQFTVAGMNFIQHTPQSDWASSTINGITGYWLRYRVTAFNNATTPPKGTQCWYESLG